MSSPPRLFYTTDVSVDRSIAELRKLLERHGAEAFGMLEHDGRVDVVFRLQGLPVRYRLEQPADDAQECRRRWRVAIAEVKLKLDLVADGGTDVATEFLARLILPGGRTFADTPPEERLEAGVGPLLLGADPPIGALPP